MPRFIFPAGEKRQKSQKSHKCKRKYCEDQCYQNTTLRWSIWIVEHCLRRVQLSFHQMQSARSSDQHGLVLFRYSQYLLTKRRSVQYSIVPSIETEQQQKKNWTAVKKHLPPLPPLIIYHGMSHRISANSNWGISPFDNWTAEGFWLSFGCGGGKGSRREMSSSKLVPIKRFHDVEGWTAKQVLFLQLRSTAELYPERASNLPIRQVFRIWDNATIGS